MGKHPKTPARSLFHFRRLEAGQGALITWRALKPDPLSLELASLPAAASEVAGADRRSWRGSIERRAEL